MLNLVQPEDWGEEIALKWQFAVSRQIEVKGAQSVFENAV
jgi:hypothetical protein